MDKQCICIYAPTEPQRLWVPIPKISSFLNMDFFSGQKPINPQMGQIESDSIREEQTKRCLDNISGVLAAAGSSIDRDEWDIWRLFLLR